jgi:tight adherence protein C
VDGIPPHVLRLLAAVCFGLAAAMLGVVAYRGLQAETLGVDADAPTNPSARRAEKRRRAIESSGFFAFCLIWIRAVAIIISRLGVRTLRNYVRVPYARAGYPGGLDDDEVVAIGVMASVAGAVFVGFSTGVLIAPAYAWLGFLALPAGFLGVIASLKTRAEVRQLRTIQAMPYVLDLIVLILRSGTSLTIALKRVVADYDDHPVGEELGQVLAEIEMGSTRLEALRRWGERAGHPDVTALADSIVQSEELGWPLADALERQAKRMAAERVLRAQAAAGSAGVMVMIPSTLVLVAAVILLLSPFIVRALRGGFRLQ